MQLLDLPEDFFYEIIPEFFDFGCERQLELAVISIDALPQAENQIVQRRKYAALNLGERAVRHKQGLENGIGFIIYIGFYDFQDVLEAISEI